MMSVIAFTLTGEAGLPSRCRMPAIPHMSYRPIVGGPEEVGAAIRRLHICTRSDLRLVAALLDLIDMRLAPFDQLLQAFIEIDGSREADFLARLDR